MRGSQSSGMRGDVAVNAGVLAPTARPRFGTVNTSILDAGWLARRKAGDAGPQAPPRPRAARRTAERLPWWSGHRATAADRCEAAAVTWGRVVIAANRASNARPSGRFDRTGTDREWPPATASLPVAVAIAGGVQPRSGDGVELQCLACGDMFVALRVDRRTCSPACARRDRTDRVAAARSQRVGRACEGCGRAFVAGRVDKRFCSSQMPAAGAPAAPPHDADRGLCRRAGWPASRDVVLPTMISIKELHGADAWRYLMESVTDGRGDLREPAAITRYFADAGTPPGRWFGSGLAGLAGGAGLSPGALVTGEQMELLFGQGRDPVTGEKLGRGFRAPRSYRDRVAARVRALPARLDNAERAERIEKIEAEERARRMRHAVAGFDYTFNPAKSVSVVVGTRRSRPARTDHRRPSRRDARHPGAARTRRRPHPGRHRRGGSAAGARGRRRGVRPLRLPRARSAAAHPPGGRQPGPG